VRQPYPPLTASVATHLDVGDGHRVYVERCGNPGGIPVVFLHGGPGSGCKPEHRQFFDPARYDILLFDQRGAGRSLPAGEVAGNDTWRLVADMEAIRQHFGLERWSLFGGSWGATLALAYAQTWPERVLGLVLRGTFLARRRDVDWFFRDGACRLLPVQWQRFVDEVGAPADTDLVEYLHAALFGPDAARAGRIARAWEAWSNAVVAFSLDHAAGPAGPTGPGSAPGDVLRTRIELHYARHGYFLAEDQLLRDAGRLPRVPAVIIHGARDLTCTPDASFALHRAYAGSRLEVLRTAGHLSSEAPMQDALVRAADEMADVIAGRAGPTPTA
jgi:proline iminopeptidase